MFDNGNGPRLASWITLDASNHESRLFWWENGSWAPDPDIFMHGNWLSLYTSFDDGSGSRIYGTLYFNGLTHIVRWNGADWEPLGGGLLYGGKPEVVDLGNGPELYAIGAFTQIGGVPFPSKVARWNGSGWEPVGAMTQYIAELAAYDDGSGTRLYAMSNCCQYSIMLFRLEGETWVPLGSPWTPPFTTYNMVGMQPFEEAPGHSSLYIAGSFAYLAPGVVSRGIARFDGTQWNPVGLGTAVSGVRGMAVMQDRHGPSLFITGGFSGLGDGSTVTRGLAQWVGCPNCYANCDLSTAAPTLNVADFTCFLHKYAASDPYANCNVDPAIDIADFTCFLQKFAAGCP